MANGFDISIAIKTTIDKILKINVPLVVYTDSRSLYDCLVKLGTTQEKRLMIDVMCLRQAYKRREIAEVKWINGTSNPADSITKTKPSKALKLLIDTNKIQLDEKEWVERTDENNTNTGDNTNRGTGLSSGEGKEQREPMRQGRMMYTRPI